jgi:hypothetical protein
MKASRPLSRSKDRRVSKQRAVWGSSLAQALTATTDFSRSGAFIASARPMWPPSAWPTRCALATSSPSSTVTTSSAICSTL